MERRWGLLPIRRGSVCGAVFAGLVLVTSISSAGTGRVEDAPVEQEAVSYQRLYPANGADATELSWDAVSDEAAQGYRMVEQSGTVHGFGDAAALGNAPVPPGRRAVDIEDTDDGTGYWVADDHGTVYAFGTATHYGDRPVLAIGESVTAISETPSEVGYWLFTNRGNVHAYGDARAHPANGVPGSPTSMVGVPLNGPVVDAIPTPSGNGYYMVGSDGGVFSFGDAAFHGSMGGIPLNEPVRSLVPDPDGTGYWLVAGDGGVFAFAAEFRGSVPGILAPGVQLNAPVAGMVPWGNGYLMVATDGGIFSFSDQPFLGSLGANPPPTPVTSVASFTWRPELEPARLVQPSDGSRVWLIPGRGQWWDHVGLRWEPSPDAVEQWLEFPGCPECTEATWDWVTCTFEEGCSGLAAPDGPAQWRVVSRSADGRTVSSETWSMSVEFYDWAINLDGKATDASTGARVPDVTARHSAGMDQPSIEVTSGFGGPGIPPVSVYFRRGTDPQYLYVTFSAPGYQSQTFFFDPPGHQDMNFEVAMAPTASASSGTSTTSTVVDTTTTTTSEASTTSP